MKKNEELNSGVADNVYYSDNNRYFETGHPKILTAVLQAAQPKKASMAIRNEFVNRELRNRSPMCFLLPVKLAVARSPAPTLVAATSRPTPRSENDPKFLLLSPNISFELLLIKALHLIILDLNYYE